MSSVVPFNRPFIVGKELEYIAQAVQSGKLAGDGPFTRKCCVWMEQTFSGRKAILTHSCTGALEMAAILIGIEKDDEIILPSYTFVSTANAFVLHGARPVFVDIRPDTLNLNETLIERAITSKTKAIIPVRYAGVACEMNTIMSLAKGNNLLVIEDAAQAVNATYLNRYLGTIGHFGCYSFHETKNVISGEGGALLVNDERFLERAEIIRDKGTNRQRFLRGQVDKYTWVDIGSSFLASELTAAFLLAQLEETHTITSRRKSIFKYYMDHFEPLTRMGVIKVPTVPPETRHNANMFYLLVTDEPTRAALIAHLGRREINAVFHYIPLHTSPMGQRFGYKQGDLPVTEALAVRLLRLPLYFGLEQTSQDRVIAAVYEFYGKAWSPPR